MGVPFVLKNPISAEILCHPFSELFNYILGKSKIVCTVYFMHTEWFCLSQPEWKHGSRLYSTNQKSETTFPRVRTIEDREFEQTRKALNARCKLLKKEGRGNRPFAAEAISDDEVSVLFKSNILGISSAEALINTVWLMNSIHFGLRASSYEPGWPGWLGYRDEFCLGFIWEISARFPRWEKVKDPGD